MVWVLRRELVDMCGLMTSSHARATSASVASWIRLFHNKFLHASQYLYFILYGVCQPLNTSLFILYGFCFLPICPSFPAPHPTLFSFFV